MTCPSCGAPRPPRGVVCAYCGTRLDLDLRGWAHLQAGGVSTDLQCPDCGTSLEVLQLGPAGTISLGRCPDCMGLFLPLGSLELLLDQAVGRVWNVDHSLLQTLADSPRRSAAPVRYRPCPRCGELMNRRLQGQRSGVVVDQCRDHGLWLDAGELRQLLEWARAGGVLLDQERQAQQTRERQVDAPATWGSPAEGSGEEMDLSTWLIRLLRQLF
ncbi:MULTISPECIES: zf-TFIIB domain-containing protein [Aphanothece]|uniref:TFIIB-type zinc ribbon-containing protein n=1 Tax=Aphanothece TaxID=1121 RepID=UPI003984DF1B